MTSAPARTDGDLPQSRESRAGDLQKLARLAACLADPLTFLAPDRVTLGPLDAADLGAIGRDPAFRGPLSKALARAAGLDEVPLGPLLLARFGELPGERLAFAFVTARPADLDAAARLLAAAVLHRRVLAMVLKADRLAVAAALGPDAFTVAVREAPLLYAPLAALDRGPSPGGADGLAPAVVGLAAAARVVAAAAPDLTALFRLRLPEAAVSGAAGQAVGDAEPLHVELAAKLMARRMPSWQAIFA
ncbi:hypothetical protein [Chthonobacter rhizosphaerae]|uniref:hypothetical protein n=1 Tax=Chthonobacter rhizosphaerae TaxID=2735553 RepID=UPI0015EE53DB|nr:hypothetical protein [Chthonobacter rhizosphaerae]